MREGIVEEFRSWGIKQFNKNGKLFEKKSIDNYHSSLNTILIKLDLLEKSGFSKVYECDNVDSYETLYFQIFSHPNFASCNKKSNYTHSSALELYRRFIMYLDAMNNKAISEEELEQEESISKEKARKLSDTELKKRITQKKNKLSKGKKVISINYSRDQEIAEYAVRRANGKCDLCGMVAPFVRNDGMPYLEAHHVDWLSRGGEDVIENVSAVCPNCHRKIHILDENEDTIKLKKRMMAYSKLLRKEKL